MSYLPKSAWDIQQSVQNGEVCAECHVSFVKPNGQEALCRDCWSLSRTPDRIADRKTRILTKHDDVDVFRGKIASRKRRGDA